MLKRALLLLLVGLLPLMSGGCVSGGRFDRKAAEAAGLNRDLQSLQQMHRQLTNENAGLKDQLKQVNDDLARLSLQRDKIAADRDELDKVLKSKSFNSAQTISELRERTAALENENSVLQERLAGLKKAKEGDVKSVSRTYETLMQEMKNEIARGQVTITELKGRLTVEVLDSALFETGEPVVKPEGQSVLQRLCPVLKNVQDKEIRIEGHTDNVQIGGAHAKEYPTLWEFSAAKAVSVARFLQQQGIEGPLLAAVAFGENRPVADNGTSEGRARNRRIAIVIQPKD